MSTAAPDDGLVIRSEPEVVELASIGLDEFRQIMGSLASGVSVITSLDEDGAPYGMTCSAVCSVSAEPPLLLTCVRTPSTTLNAIRSSGRFLVNFLDADALALSDLFASRTPDKFAEVGWRHSDRLGLPQLERTVAHAECLVHDVVTAGDHAIVLGRIIDGQAIPDRFPLGYWRGRYVQVFRVAEHTERS